MRTLLTIGLFGVGLAIATAPTAAHARVAPSAKADVAAISTAYLDGMFRFRPHLAAFMGDHRFDDRLMNVSAPAVANRLAELDALEKRCDAVEVSPTNPIDSLVDMAIVKKGVALERLYLTKIRLYLLREK